MAIKTSLMVATILTKDFIFMGKKVVNAKFCDW